MLSQNIEWVLENIKNPGILLTSDNVLLDNSSSLVIFLWKKKNHQKTQLNE